MKVNSVYFEFSDIDPSKAGELKILILGWLMKERVTVITVETGLVDRREDDSQIDLFFNHKL